MDCEASMCDLLERMLLDASIEPTDLPLSLLKTITNNFSADQQIGSGGFSVVYKGLLPNCIVAVKKLSQTLDVDEKKFNQEVDSLMRVKHKNIVRFLGYCADTQGKVWRYEGKNIIADIRQRLLCFEFLPKGSLDQYITDASHGLEWKIRYQIMKGVCEGLHYLHKNNILHLDLKPANILLNDNMVPKITDFGLSRCFDEKQSRAITSKLVGSMGYVAPEFFSKVITFKLDIYSLGVIILEILTGQRGFTDIKNVTESWKNRFKTSQTDTRLEQVRVCTEIGIECIDSNPEKRPDTHFIIQVLHEMECTYGFIGTDLCTSSGKYQEKGSAVELQGTPKVLGETSTENFKDGPIKADFSATSNVTSPSMENPKRGPLTPQSKRTEYITLNFYMHQIIDGPNRNQVNIADPKQPSMFGYTNVHDYPIYDSLGPGPKIIARAQGLHSETNMNNDDWFHWSSIVFNDERFQGSSFNAIGNQNKDEGEWAIVGGTGVFTFAQGTISIRRLQGNGPSNIKEIRISAFFGTPQATASYTKAFKGGLIKVVSGAIPNVGSPSMINAQSGPVSPQSQEPDYNLTLYMDQTIVGPNHKHVNIADPKQPHMFGCTNVHDYPIYGSLGHSAKIVARAQGLHTETSMNYDDWFYWSSIVFIDERFLGSSFKVIGNQNEVEGEWAIVGGTGVFTLAQGTIFIRGIQYNGSSNVKEIRIRAFCRKPETSPTDTETSKNGVTDVDFNATSNVSSPSSMVNAQSGLATTQFPGTVYNRVLFMHQTLGGEHQNQVNIADPEQDLMFGFTNVHDYPIYDSVDSRAKIVARAQGLHTKTNMDNDDWFHWSSIVFYDERFRGSSFKAIGNQNKVEGEWVIVGGTGAFTCAQGTISIYRIQGDWFSNIKEIRISAALPPCTDHSN